MTVALHGVSGIGLLETFFLQIFCLGAAHATATMFMPKKDRENAIAALRPAKNRRKYKMVNKTNHMSYLPRPVSPFPASIK